MRTLRVVTLNIWNQSGPWQQRLQGIRAGLAEIDPDVVGLQEVLRPSSGEAPDQARQIAEGLGYHVAYAAAFDSGGIEFGNAALSKFPILRSEVFPLPNVDTGESRCLLFAELDAPLGPIPFFVTHLNWRFHEGYVREAQVMAIAEQIKRLAPIGGFPPVVVGDFNAAPDADEIRFMKGLSTLGGKTKSVYFADTFAIVGRGDGTTFSRHNPYASDLREPNRRIDYIFVRGPDARGRGEPLDAHVCFDRPIDGIYPSDHFGVSATIRAEV
jgi:endonuclease/exonuclease/phosphatase family metal-dependent hydrolase